MIRLSNNFFIVIAAIASASLTACGGSSSSSSSPSEQPATFNLSIVDGPVDAADAVVIAFDEVEIKPASGASQVLVLDASATIDLLNYQGEVSAPLLNNVSLTAGAYNWIRLGVDASASYIEVNGAQFPLDIPSAAQTGLKLNRGFTLAAGGVSNFTIEFDLRKSVHQDGNGNYKLRPTLRLLDNLEVGTIAGTVDRLLIEDVACANNGDNNDQGNLVYLFASADATPIDIQGQATDPLTSASVVYDNGIDGFRFTLGFIPEGDYTIAFTCDGLIDDPQQADELFFGATAQVTVEAGGAAHVALAAAAP
jgi:hypothetical protein